MEPGSEIISLNSLQQKVHQIKLVTLGESGAGKSALVTRLVQNRFLAFTLATIGADFQTRTLSLEDKVIKFDVWDTAGHERYRDMCSMLYRNAHAAIVVYDIQNLNSLSTAKYWVSRLRDELTSNIVIALVGNKTDLADRRCISFDETNNYAEENGLIFMETSAKTGINVVELFSAIAKKLLSGSN